jgi:hypothetical protein
LCKTLAPSSRTGSTSTINPTANNQLHPRPGTPGINAFSCYHWNRKRSRYCTGQAIICLSIAAISSG